MSPILDRRWRFVHLRSYQIIIIRQLCLPAHFCRKLITDAVRKRERWLGKNLFSLKYGFSAVGGRENAAGEAKPEEIVAKLRQVDVLASQGRSVAAVVRAISVRQFSYYRWRKEFDGLKGSQVKRLKDLEKENERIRKVVSDLTLDKLILREAASGNL